jgi:hypothetical protein
MTKRKLNGGLAGGKAPKHEPSVEPLKGGVDAQEPIKLHLPIHSLLPLPENIDIEPVHVDPETIKPLVVPIKVTRCELTRVDPLVGAKYLWCRLPEGQDFPEGLEEPGSTIHADVHFFPPSELGQ